MTSFKEMMDFASMAHLFSDLASARKGQEPREDAPKAFKAAMGIFGKGDELEVKSDTMYRPADHQEMLYEDWHWLFDPEPENPQQWLESIWYRNEFFTFIAKIGMMNTPEKRGEKVLIVRMDGDGKSYTETKTTEDIMSDLGINGKKELIDQMIMRLRKSARLSWEKVEVDGKMVIPHEPAFMKLPKAKRVAAYKKEYKFYKASPVPCYKVGERDLFDWIATRYGLAREQVETAYKAAKLDEYIPKVWGKVKRTAIAGETALVDDAFKRIEANQQRMDRTAAKQAAIRAMLTRPFRFIFNKLKG